MQFKADRKANSVEIRFREGIYQEKAVDNAIGMLEGGLKADKSKDKEYFVVRFKPRGKTDLEGLAWEFCNLVIACRKGAGSIL
ncbi:MAG: HxsD-like protein [Candidatus Diapherotrites archaeon]|nr:HxsD-like protein [Candidatus Diapherotrites archaeon]